MWLCRREAEVWPASSSCSTWLTDTDAERFAAWKCTHWRNDCATLRFIEAIQIAHQPELVSCGLLGVSNCGVHHRTRDFGAMTRMDTNVCTTRNTRSRGYLALLEFAAIRKFGDSQVA